MANRNADAYERAEGILLAHLDDRFADEFKLAVADDIDRSEVLMALTGLAAAAYDVIGRSQGRTGQDSLQELIAQMRVRGALEFPSPFEGL